MKSVLIFVVLLNPLLNVTNCSSTNSVQKPKSSNIKADVFNIEGKWLIEDVVFVGNPNDVKFSKELNLYSLFGTGWNATKGKYFVFETGSHWNSIIFDKELSQKEFTYEFADNLVLVLKGKELNYRFPIIIKDSIADSMTWDIGNDVNLILHRVQ